MKKLIHRMSLIELFSAGFSSGNYDQAYFDTDLESAYGERDDDGADSKAYRAGYVLGFFSSFAVDEIPKKHTGEHETTVNEWRERAEKAGIAID